MAVIIVCGLAVLAALALTVRWRAVHHAPMGAGVRPYTRATATVGAQGPPTTTAEDPAGPRSRAARAVRWVLRELVIIVTTGIATGLLLVGPAARLAMRLLAVTAGDAAQGRTTEADEIVGRITVGGSIGLIIFVGLGFGVVSALAYGALRWLLPDGLAGGLLLGALLFAVVGPRIDPVRADNPDFGIVGPGWLSLLVFLLMALAQGAALAAFHARLSRAVPLPSRSSPRSLLWLLTLGPVIVTGVGAIALALILAVAVAAGALATPPSAGVFVGARRLGQALLAVLGVASLPGLIDATSAILRASP